MSVISSLVPKSWVKSILAAIIVFAGGWSSKAILGQVGQTYELAPGVSIVVTQEIADRGTNTVAVIVARLQAALQK
jgi:hypothetical protein